MQLGLASGSNIVDQAGNAAIITSSTVYAVIPPAPTTTNAYGNSSVQLDAHGVGDLVWYTSPTGGTGSLTQPDLDFGETEGAHTFYVASRTADGVESDRSALTLVYDGIAPTVTLNASSILTGGVRSYLLSGKVSDSNPGSLVSLYDDTSTTALATATVQADGSWTAWVKLSAGEHSVMAEHIDKAGNFGNSNVVAISVAIEDPTPPATGPYGLTLATASDSGVSGSDNLTNKSSITISGHGVSGSTVQLFDDANGNGLFDRGERSLGTAAVVDGDFTRTVSLSGDGEHRIVAAQRDPSGLGTGSDPLIVTLDRTPTSVTEVKVTGDGLIDGSGTLTVGQTAVFTLSLSEAVERSQISSRDFYLALSNGGRALYDAAASTDTHLAFSYTVLADHLAEDLTVLAGRNSSPGLMDAAGNLFRFTGATTNPDGTLTIDGLTGTSADEKFRGTLGADSFHGGGGDDRYVVNHVNDTVFEAKDGGTDTVLTSVSYTLMQGQAIEILQTIDPASQLAINLAGNEFAQRILGNAGDNRIEGGGGADLLTGGAGADTFVYRAASDSSLGAHDTIRDFSHAQGDLIDLSSIVTGASDGHFHFVAQATAFSQSAGEMIVTQKGRIATVQGDLDGDKVADIVISVVTGGTLLNASDFLLIA